MSNINLLEKYWGSQELSTTREVEKKEPEAGKVYKGILQRVILKTADEINKRTNQPYGRSFLTFSIWIPELQASVPFFLAVSAEKEEELKKIMVKINVLIRHLKLEHSKDYQEMIQNFLDLEGKNLKVLYRRRDPQSLKPEYRYDMLKVDTDLTPKVEEKIDDNLLI